MKNNTISLQTRNLRSLFLLLGLIFVYLNPASGQNCFIPLSDVSGMTPTQGQLDSLKYAACRLRDSLPAEFQSAFKVYDFGFYLHGETKEGGYPEAFQKAINIARDSSPYYLIFGKQTDKNGVYTKFWVQIKLPVSGGFYCLSQETPNFNFDLSHKYQVVTNSFYQENKITLQFYSEAEQKTMEQLAILIGKIKRCCIQNTKTCDVCLLTPKEIRNYLEGQGYTATPIKILNANAAKKNSTQNKPILSRIASLCSAITSIEIDGKICNDFPAVINHIMEAHPDSEGKAKISDDDCLCDGGGLEYYNAGPPYPDTLHIRLKIHLSKGINGLAGMEDDMLYSQIIAPYHLGALPFNAYIPNRISESERETPPIHMDNINMNYVKSTVESIFSKNGINLSSISLQMPAQPYKNYDIYNGLVWYGNDKGFAPYKVAGRSQIIFHIPTPIEYALNGTNFVEFERFESHFSSFENDNHFNYVIGYHFAHELLHQMITMSLGYFEEYGLKVGTYKESNIDDYYYGLTAGHTNDQINLLLEGSYFQTNSIIDNCKFISEELKSKLRPFSGWVGFVKILCPKKITLDYQQIEQISPGTKALFTYFKIMRSLLETYPDKTSCEIVCGSKILVNTIKMMKLQKYDGF